MRGEKAPNILVSRDQTAATALEMGGINYAKPGRAVPADEEADDAESSWEELPTPPQSPPPPAGTGLSPDSAAGSSRGGRAMLGAGGGAGAKGAKPSFVSYLGPQEVHTRETINPHLLPGELLLCEANMVLKYIQDDGSSRGTCGKLICTNFKISFLGDESALDDEPQFKNKIIGENDITLQCVDQLYGVYDEKKKSLYGQLRKYPEKIIIYCKDLRVFHFCLRYTKEEEVKRIVSGIAHQAQTPKLFKRLFLFSYATTVPAQNNTELKNQTVMFDSVKDWRQELERTKGNLKFKAMSVNEGYKVSKKLPPYFVVPMTVSEESILRYQGRGIPIWCWSCHNGAALLKMSALPKEQDDSTSQMYKTFLDGMYKSIDKPPYEAMKADDLSSSLPPLQEIQIAYTRFKQLFLVDNSADFWDTDVKWFSLLESTNWLETVRRCLRKAVEVTESLEAQNINVLLIEENASDLCCVISSLVQVMMDSYYRTKLGFQSLLQKEWIMGGHAFLDRCNHLRQSDKEEAPVFLFFLDCVWQLLQQYPQAFEFTETYLTVLSDSLYIPIFSTFFFNSPHHKDTTTYGGNLEAQGSPLNYLSVWDWSVQFESEAQALLNNPLYAEKLKLSQRKTSRFKHQRQLSLPLTQTKPPPKRGFFKEETDQLIKNILGKRISKLITSSDELQSNSREFYDSWHCKPVDLHGLLLPRLEGPEIKVWAQRYLRWIPEAQLPGGGTVATATKVLDVMEDVQSLQKKVDERQSQIVSEENTEASPFVRNPARLSSLFPFALLQRHSFKPVLPTSTWKDLEGEADLARRDDEFVDLGDV
ncbi:myotubularin-related protein 12 isoform X2 [Hemicordylus capensis]|uniref:myotubularin-related protein 12 isoform X2 n=1 Tax=Hemicordylus capensis TaxID=884348 RepID=UPI002303359C|nr:myotubularin-related protein 12 isoform X2 [Hemicordylus capensis]